MADETAQEKAVDRAHRLLIARILDGSYPIGAELPGERSLSKDLGIARTALREAMQRLSHDGWLEISQGRATRVRDYLRDGNLNILIDLITIDHSRPMTFVPDLLQMWGILAQDYTARAVENEGPRIVERLELYMSLADQPEAYAQAMWQLHRSLIDYAGNMVYGLIFNSFANFYRRLAVVYFEDPARREQVRAMWGQLIEAAQRHDSTRAADILAAHILNELRQWDISRNPGTREKNLPEGNENDDTE